MWGIKIGLMIMTIIGMAAFFIKCYREYVEMYY